MAVEGNRVREMIDFINNSGLGAIGTPDRVTRQIKRLQEQSTGGFGAYLLLAHEWANPVATNRSFRSLALKCVLDPPQQSARFAVVIVVVKRCGVRMLECFQRLGTVTRLECAP